MTGKFELEYEGELKGADFVARELIRAAVSRVFDGYFPDADVRSIVEWFDLGGTLNLGDGVSAKEVVAQARGVQGLVELALSRRHRARRRGSAGRVARSTSCSRASTRRRRSAAPTIAATTAPSRSAVVKPDRLAHPGADAG